MISIKPRSRVAVGVVAVCLIGWLLSILFLVRAALDQVAGRDPRRDLLFAVVAAIATLPGAAAMLVIRRSQSIVVDQNELQIRLGPLANQRVGVHEIGSVELHTGMLRHLVFDGLPIVIRDSSGRIRAFLDPSYWTPSDLDRVWTRLGVTVVHRSGPIRWEEYAEQMRWARWSWTIRSALTGLVLGLLVCLPIFALELARRL